MLYTKKGDDGSSNFKWDCDQRISKSSAIAEALGSLDEINSYLGLCKVQSDYLGYKLGNRKISEIVHEIQSNLFTIQAEITGAEKTIGENEAKELEDMIDMIEKELPPIKSFFISGGVPDIPKWQLGAAGLSAIFDIARTVAKRAERRVIAVSEEVAQLQLPVSDAKLTPAALNEGKKNISKHTIAYLNRLSSALYALARYSSHKTGIMEEALDYQ